MERVGVAGSSGDVLDQVGRHHQAVGGLLEADPAEALSVSHESKELAWVAVDAVVGLNPAESMARMVRKTLQAG